MLARLLICRSIWLAAVAACFVAPVIAQEEPAVADDLPAVSLQRLTVGVTSSFFYAPWKDLNDSFGSVRDAYAYNAVLGLQDGHIDRHRGDLSVGIDLTYRIVGPISLALEAVRTFSGAEMEVRSASNGYTFYSLSGTSKFHNSFDLGVTNVGGGLVIDLPGSLSPRILILAGRADATLDYSFEYAGAIERGRFDATLKDHGTFIVIGLETSIPVWGPISFSLGAQYRSLRFAALEGNGTATQDYSLSSGYRQQMPFRARLVRSGAYFGVDVEGDWPVWGWGERIIIPWAAAPGSHHYSTFLRDAVPTTLYLNGFGIRGGLNYAF